MNQPLDPQIAARIEIERKVIAHLIQTAKAAGYALVAVDDGEERVSISTVNTEAEALEAVFAVDESRIIFRHPEELKGHCAVIVLGNDGWDCVADASMGGRWDAVIEANAVFAETFCAVDDDSRSYGPHQGRAA
jgi:hypothetical protein